MMYPQKEDITDLPFSEKEVYEFLEKLGDGYVIFHSVQWMKRSNKWKSTWKENDFLILHRKLGALVLEVKGGDIVYRDGAFNQINQVTNEVHILSEKKRNDPLSQAIDGIYHYRRALSNIAYGCMELFFVPADQLLQLFVLLRRSVVLCRLDIAVPKFFQQFHTASSSQIISRRMISSARLRMLFIVPTHAIWSAAFNSSVTPSSFFI